MVRRRELEAGRTRLIGSPTFDDRGVDRRSLHHYILVIGITRDEVTFPIFC